MPAKKVISKQNIVEAALKIVRKEGMEGLNMRSVAKACNCSTQPIYLSFTGIGELKAAVAGRIVEIYHGYINGELSSGEYPPYKATGMGYIRFAKEQPQLFKYLFMSRGGASTVDGYPDFNDDIFQIMGQIGIPQDKAGELHAHMWVWVHGIAAMYATGYLNWDWNTVSGMLTDAFMGIKQRLGI